MLLVVSVAVAVAPQEANAFSISTFSDYYLHNSDDGINTSRNAMKRWEGNNGNSNYCLSVSPFSAYSSRSSMSCWKSRTDLNFSMFEKGHVMRWNSSSSDANGFLFSMSLTKVERNTNNFNFRVYNDISRTWDSYLSNSDKATYTFSGSTYDKVFFWDDTIIFYNSETLETLQHKAGVTYHNGILLANPYDSDSVDNLRLVKLQEGKARSTSVPMGTAGDYMVGNIILSDTQIYSLFGDSSTTKMYNIQRGGVNPLPFQEKWKYNQTDRAIKSSYPEEQMFLYSYTNDFQAPNDSSTLPDSNTPNNNQDTNYYNGNLVAGYNECVNKGENLRKAVHLAVMCRYQDEDALRENIIIRTGLDYTGTASYCIQLDNFIVNAYQLYSGNWNNGLMNENANLQDNSAPFNDLIFSWYYNSVVVDDHGTISGLPSGNSWCTAWTMQNFANENQSRIEKVSNTFNNYFGSGITNIYTNSLGNGMGFSGMISSITEGVSGYFNSSFFSPYITEFNNGKTTFQNLVNVPECSVIRLSGWHEYSWGSIALYGFGAFMLFILLMLF